MTNTLWIRFQVDNRDFDLISIYFQLKSISFNIIVIFWSKLDQKWSIKRSKKLIKRSKKSIKRSKKSIYIEKVNIIWLFYISRSFSISFWLKSIKFDLFNIIVTCFNQFCGDELKSSFKFGLKKLIKSQFDHD